MIKRTIDISGQGRTLRVRNRQLVIERDGDGPAEIPLDDLGLVMLDEGHILYTHATMAALADAGVAVVFCGRDHHPAGILLPVAGNQLHTKRLRSQIDAGRPLVKQLWKKIIQRKLQNQAKALGEENIAYKRLMELANNVRSGDPDNCEAQGAAAYFQAQFGSDFRREREGAPPNNLLNYGYMVLRASVARAVCLSGLHPALGLHHKHRNNPFCLADDLMEPYRPIVDMAVKELTEEGFVEIEKDSKRVLLGLLEKRVQLWRGKGPLFVAVQKSAASLAQCFEEGHQNLDLPRL